MSVYFRCKQCGDAHPPPIAFAEKLYLDASATIDLSFDCPATGESAVYNRTDLFWTDHAREGDSPARMHVGTDKEHDHRQVYRV